jgi:hypothetical protein
MPALLLTIVCLIFCALGWLAFNDIRQTVGIQLEQGDALAPGILAEIAVIVLMLFSVPAFLVLHLTLPLRLTFTEKGIRRRTVLPPRFIAWDRVRGASLGVWRGHIWLELKVGRWRSICIPLSDYRRAASLLAEIRERLSPALRRGLGIPPRLADSGD